MPLAAPANAYPRRAGGDTAPAPTPGDPGWAAIASACAMQMPDSEARFRWLYDYGAEPLTPGHAGAPDATSALLSTATRAGLARVFDHQRHGNWDVWSRATAAEPPVWKAYVNPRFADLAKLELRIGALLLDPHVAAFKTVAQRWMALRPDKFMVYFAAPAHRAVWIARATPYLSDLAANPVPFTACADSGGIITTARDPDDAPGQSWRSTLLRRIAGMIAPPAPSDRASLTAMLRHGGIDAETWTWMEDTDA
jgi:hypothetical protein